MVGANCFVCLSRSYFDKFLVLYQIKGFCQHSQSSFSASPTFRVSKTALIFNMLVTLSLLFPVVTYLQSLKAVCTVTRSLCLILMADQIFVMISILLEILLCVEINTIRQEMLTWLNIFENRNFYGLGVVADKKKIRKFVMARSLAIMISLFSCVLSGIYLFSDHGYDNLPRSYARNISLAVTSTFESFIFFEVVQKIFIMGALLDAMKTALRKTYFNRDFSVFKKHVHLMAIINYNMKLVMNLMTVLLMGWILTCTMYLIFNIYALTDYASYNFITIMVTQGKTIFFIITWTIFFYIHDENLKKKVSLSFL
jgi:hypothetical protein